MGNTKYNVLFMRDDDTVKRYRLSPFWLGVFVWFIVLLAACASVGAWSGYKFWNQNVELRQDKLELQKTLNEASVQLERLENVNKILDSYDPNEVQSLLASVPVEEKKVEPAPLTDLKKLLFYKNLMRAGVENVKLRYSGGSLALSFDLNNLQTSSSLSGSAKVELIGSNGKGEHIKANSNDMSFHIQRFKVVRTRFAMPSGMSLKDMYGLRLMISTTNNELIFSEVYPLSRIFN
ncbi:hypothetical protein [Maridesulfovibrio ferrireducens]|uniref:Uncharacterized protein n=1 Tax=Maridesulfovibrio ferrireducens TaxID=246191 RepID=A0A1G9KI09_9BACT|nr:hypothetical protein [Maridesulfovibrio ferrireducens]MBI9110743.1 hypothetical protein [Maridesulfovibrio ferrireducens]SDL49500.1 hypothetical protein SAMN05660337_3097 [Maridesulfovibrio ferrireducens]